MIKEYKKYLRKETNKIMGFNESNLEGQIGEEMYINYLKDKNIEFFDVREDLLCQWMDIDFIIPSNNHTKEEILKEVKHAKPDTRATRQKEIGYTVEVKLDKVTHNRFKKYNGDISEGTGNLVYELISHNMPGCLARSYADFILYVCVDNFDSETILKKAYMINLYKWRQAMVNTGKNNTQHIVLKPTKYVKENNELVEENILNILHPVKDLLTIDGAVKDLTDTFMKYFPKNINI
jgi:hypothetical protein